MGPVGTGDWGLGLGLDNLAVIMIELITFPRSYASIVQSLQKEERMKPKVRYWFVFS